MSSNYLKFLEITTHYFSSHCCFVEASSAQSVLHEINLEKDFQNSLMIHAEMKNVTSSKGHQLYMPTGLVSPILTSKVKQMLEYEYILLIYSSFCYHQRCICNDTIINQWLQNYPRRQQLHRSVTITSTVYDIERPAIFIPASNNYMMCYCKGCFIQF